MFNAVSPSVSLWVPQRFAVIRGRGVNHSKGKRIKGKEKGERRKEKGKRIKDKGKGERRKEKGKRKREEGKRKRTWSRGGVKG
jgi:hypothetical protein